MGAWGSKGVGVGHPRATTSLTQIGVLGSWVQAKGTTPIQKGPSLPGAEEVSGIAIPKAASAAKAMANLRIEFPPTQQNAGYQKPLYLS
jgi:hypothetical protein